MNKTLSEHYRDLYNVDYLRSCLDDYSAPQAEGLNVGEMGSLGRLMAIQGATPIRKRAKHREVQRAYKQQLANFPPLSGLLQWVPKPEDAGKYWRGGIDMSGSGPKSCECGKDKHGFATHSSWCPLHTND